MNTNTSFIKERDRVIKGLTLVTKSADWGAIDEYLQYEQTQIKDRLVRTKEFEDILELQGMYSILTILRNLPKTVDHVNKH